MKVEHILFDSDSGLPLTERIITEGVKKHKDERSEQGTSSVLVSGFVSAISNIAKTLNFNIGNVQYISNDKKKEKTISFLKDEELKTLIFIVSDENKVPDKDYYSKLKKFVKEKSKNNKIKEAFDILFQNPSLVGDAMDNNIINFKEFLDENLKGGIFNPGEFKGLFDEVNLSSDKLKEMFTRILKNIGKQNQNNLNEPKGITQNIKDYIKKRKLIVLSQNFLEDNINSFIKFLGDLDMVEHLYENSEIILTYATQNTNNFKQLFNLKINDEDISLFIGYSELLLLEFLREVGIDGENNIKMFLGGLVALRSYFDQVGGKGEIKIRFFNRGDEFDYKNSIVWVLDESQQSEQIVE